MEKNKRMQFYGGTLGACAPLLVFMCLMIVIAAMKKVSLVLFCMAGFAGLCVAFLLAKNKKEFEQAVVDGLKNDTLCVIIFAFLLAGILSQELRQSGLIQGLTWLVMKLGLSAGFLPLVAFLVCLLISTACGTSSPMARSSSAWANTSAGVPSANCSPSFSTRMRSHRSARASMLCDTMTTVMP